MPHDPYRALYLHIPFCVKRCNYCDFATQALEVDSPAIDEYIESLVLQIRQKAKEGELDQVETIYIGGGTPSYVGLSRLSMLLYTLSLSLRLEPDVECSMEANPESINERLIRDIWALGVNRLSIGVQSFDDEVLAILGRAHTSEDAQQAVRCAQERFDNVSVDLMAGIPGQSDASFTESVKTAIDLGVKHVSIYPLTIEPNTPFYKMYMRGELADTDEDTQARHMEIAETLLRDAGFERYEVASYAKPGYACKHNCAYWTGVPYVGLGRSAATMTQNESRRMRLQDGQVTDDLDRAQLYAEDLMLGMRMSAGVSDELVAQAAEVLPALGETLNSLADRGLVEHAEGAWKPTERGWLCGNELYGELFDLAP